MSVIRPNTMTVKVLVAINVLNLNRKYRVYRLIVRNPAQLFPKWNSFESILLKGFTGFYESGSLTSPEIDRRLSVLGEVRLRSPFGIQSNELSRPSDVADRNTVASECSRGPTGRRQ